MSELPEYPMPYEVFEHTADVGLHAFGRTLPELFAHAVQGMESLLVPAEEVRVVTSRQITVDGHDTLSLLIAWLSELVFLFDTEYLLFRISTGATGFPSEASLRPMPRKASSLLVVLVSISTAVYACLLLACCGTNVLVGAAGSMEQTFGTCCHGAGRRQSRTAAKKSISSKDLLARLDARGVTVRVHSKNLLPEEAPQAYKDAQKIVNVVHNAGLAQLVARLRPIIVVKG